MIFSDMFDSFQAGLKKEVCSKFAVWSVFASLDASQYFSTRKSKNQSVILIQ